MSHNTPEFDSARDEIWRLILAYADCRVDEARTHDVTASQYRRLAESNLRDALATRAAHPAGDAPAAANAEIKSFTPHRLEWHDGAIRAKAWADMLARFSRAQRLHLANLMAHEWTICAVEIQSKYGSTPHRIEAENKQKADT